jgi:hypothetical protein
MLTEIIEHCKGWFRNLENELFVGLLLVLVATLSFGLGRMSKIEDSREPVKIDQIASMASTSINTAVPQAAEGREYVASKNGTKYHLPWCSGAQRISEANKIYFKSKDEAERAGYSPAANCKGL